MLSTLTDAECKVNGSVASPGIRGASWAGIGDRRHGEQEARVDDLFKGRHIDGEIIVLCVRGI